MNFIIENFKSFKTILIVLGLTAVIVFSIMLVGYESYLDTTIMSTSMCTDSDNGKNYYQKGIVTLSDGTKLTDYCMTGGYKDNVMEYYCAVDGHGMTNFKCPNSCVNGACVKEITPTCTDSDGGVNVMKKGTATDNSHSYTDYCIGNSIVEYFCKDGVAKRASDSPSGYSCSRYGQNMICRNGACVEGTTSEICDGIDNDGDGLIDEGNLCQSGYKCQNGKCVKEITPTCTDSDGGVNVMKKGTATDNSHSYTDYCIGNSIVEYFCKDGVAKRASDSPSGYSCSRYGQNMICDDGACKKGEPEPKCEADGKCKYPGCPNGDPDCSCTEQGGNICQTDEICPEVSLKHKDSGICCPVSCIPEAIYSISGQIINSENISVSGISMNLTGTSSASTATNSDGNYSFINLANGSYIVTPFNDTWTFFPTSQNVTISSSNVSGINFTAIPDLCKQYFEVQDENSAPIVGAEVFVQGAFSEISGGPACDTDNNGRCYVELRRIEKNHTAEAKKDGYECYNNECQRTFDGCLAETIVLKLKKPAVYQTADLNCDKSVNAGDFGILLSWWNKNPSGFVSCQSPDINNDGNVNAGDFGIMMSQWTTF